MDGAPTVSTATSATTPTVPTLPAGLPAQVVSTVVAGLPSLPASAAEAEALFRYLLLSQLEPMADQLARALVAELPAAEQSTALLLLNSAEAEVSTATVACVSSCGACCK
jgi:hypothetical protein